MTTEHPTENASEQDETPYPMPEDEVRQLWKRRHEAAFVFVSRDLKRRYGHAFPYYCFPEAGVLVRCLSSLGFGFADSAWRFPLHPGSAAGVRSYRGIRHPQRLRFLDRVTYSEREDLFTKTRIPGIGLHRHTGSVLGAWRCIGAVAFTMSRPADVEAFAAACERREFVFAAEGS